AVWAWGGSCLGAASAGWAAVAVDGPDRVAGCGPPPPPAPGRQGRHPDGLPSGGDVERPLDLRDLEGADGRERHAAEVGQVDLVRSNELEDAAEIGLAPGALG